VNIKQVAIQNAKIYNKLKGSEDEVASAIWTVQANDTSVDKVVTDIKAKGVEVIESPTLCKVILSKLILDVGDNNHKILAALMENAKFRGHTLSKPDYFLGLFKDSVASDRGYKKVEKLSVMVKALALESFVLTSKMTASVFLSVGIQSKVPVKDVIALMQHANFIPNTVAKTVLVPVINEAFLLKGIIYPNPADLKDLFAALGSKYQQLTGEAAADVVKKVNLIPDLIDAEFRYAEAKKGNYADTPSGATGTEPVGPQVEKADDEKSESKKRDTTPEPEAPKQPDQSAKHDEVLNKSRGLPEFVKSLRDELNAEEAGQTYAYMNVKFAAFKEMIKIGTIKKAKTKELEALIYKSAKMLESGGYKYAEKPCVLVLNKEDQLMKYEFDATTVPVRFSKAIKVEDKSHEQFIQCYEANVDKDGGQAIERIGDVARMDFIGHFVSESSELISILQ
jgi:hypothetical protein